MKDFQLILDLCRKRNSVGQMTFYNMFYKSVYNSCFRILNDSDKAEDVMQETFLTVFEQIEKFSGDENAMKSYLRRIAVNHSIDIYRKKQHHIQPLNEEHELIPDDSDDVECINFTDIANAVMQMPEGYRMILSLRLFEEMDFEEIAMQMNITASTVRSQFARARKKLVDRLNSKF